jgi:hypothetical protein
MNTEKFSAELANLLKKYNVRIEIDGYGDYLGIYDVSTDKAVLYINDVKLTPETLETCVEIAS